MILGWRFLQTEKAREGAAHKVHLALYHGIRRCIETQVSLDSRMLHILNRPSTPSVFRERIN